MVLPLPGLPSFDYVRAESPEQVTELLAKHPEEARLFMGGTDIFVQMRDGNIAPKILMDVKSLPGIASIDFDVKVGLHLGAAATMNAVARDPDVKKHFPLLAEAVDTVASYQVRNRATVGGNLCNASPAADTAPALLVLEATLIANGSNGKRVIPISEFFRGPGASALEPGEFLVRIDVPIPPKGWVGRYLKLGRNAAGDLAVVGVAVIGYPDRSTTSGYRFRIALASVAPTPIRVHEAEEVLSNNPTTDEIIEKASEATQAAAAPVDDVRASARYRKEMIKVFTRRGLHSTWAMLRKEG